MRSESPEWHRLLHYKPAGWGLAASGFESQVDGPDFFVDLRGKTDPAAEWRADSTALWDTLTGGDTRFECRFPARSRWMRGQLTDVPFPASRVCPAFENFRSTLAVDSVALVFASSYINSPPSAFGHVYLKLLQRHPRGTAGLSDYTVGYGAQMEGAGPLKVVVAGFAGTFKGYYNVFSFDASVRKYSHHDNRDQWLFHLALTAAETQRLVEHLWELRQSYLYYAFLTENCAYHLATLLEGSRFDLDLNRSPISTPLSLLHELDETGILLGARELPSLRSTLEARIEALPDSGRTALKAMLHEGYRTGPAAGFADTSRARLYDLASLHMDYRYGTDWILDTALHARKLDLLEARATLPDYPDVIVPTGLPPTRSHKAGRVEVGPRLSANGRDPALTVTAMPALQVLTDDATGLSETAEFKLLELRGSMNSVSRLPRFERLTVVDLFNFQPSTPLLPSLSWRTSLALQNGDGFFYPDGPFTADFLLGFGRSFSESTRHRSILTVLGTAGSIWNFGAMQADPFLGLQFLGLWNAGARTRAALQVESKWFARTGAQPKADLTVQHNFAPDYGALFGITAEDLSAGGVSSGDVRIRLGAVAHW